MSPLLMRVFALVAMALAAASMQMKARAVSLPATPVAQADSPCLGPAAAADDNRLRVRNDR